MATCPGGTAGSSVSAWRRNGAAGLGSIGKRAMHSEQGSWAARWSPMEPTTEYQRFAEECRRLALEAKTERHRKIMEEMAQAWMQLAEETDQESSHASP